MKEDERLTQTWKEYERGKNYLSVLTRYSQIEKNNNFYIGRQWIGVESGDMSMPVKNIIKPICDYKIGVVSQNTVSIVYSSANFSDEDLKMIEGTSFKDQADREFKLLNKYTAKIWENNNMDAKQWDIIKEACVSGDAYVYTYIDDNGKEQVEMINDTDIYFSDENDPEIQNQEYILIKFRRPVSQIREEARENGIKESDIELIVRDNDTSEQTGDKNEVDTDLGKCLCILKLYKKNGTIHVTKSVKKVEYQPEFDTKCTLYPVAHYGWITLKNMLRSMGEPESLINNQIEINKILARRSVAVTLASYPKLAYLTESIANPQDLSKVGVGIGIKGKNIDQVSKAVDYLRPVQISPDAKALNDELTQDTRELAGAGDVALGLTNPENASGKAIIAVRDNAVLPLNLNVAGYKKFVEDLARIWFDMWTHTSGEDGKRIVIEEPDEETKELVYGKPQIQEPSAKPRFMQPKIDELPDEPIVEVIHPTVLERLKASIRVDISNANPYSKYAEEQSLEGLLQGGMITFEEYVEALPNDSISPKDKLERILDDREKAQEQINNQEMDMMLKKQNMEAQMSNQQIDVGLDQEMVGGENELSNMSASGNEGNEPIGQNDNLPMS